MTDFTIEQFDESNCESYSIANLKELARFLKLDIDTNTNAGRLCLSIRSSLPSEYTQYNGRYFFDSHKMKQILDNVTDEEKEVYRFVWNHTKFIPTQQVLNFVDNAINKFLDYTKELNSSDFLIWANPKKWGSEHWLMTVFYDKLRKPVYIEDFTCLLNKPTYYNIIIIDDAIYSGHNIDHTIYNAINDLSTLLKCDTQDLHKLGYYFKFYIIVGLSTEIGKESIKKGVRYISDGHIDVEFFIGAKMETIEEIVKKEGYNMNWYVFNNSIILPPDDIKEYSKKSLKLKPVYKGTTTVWLGHKIANVHGTTEPFIRPILLNDPSRKIVEESKNLQTMFQKYNC